MWLPYSYIDFASEVLTTLQSSEFLTTLLALMKASHSNESLLMEGMNCVAVLCSDSM